MRLPNQETQGDNYEESMWVNPTRGDPTTAGIKGDLGPVRPRALKSKLMNIISYKCYTIL